MLLGGGRVWVMHVRGRERERKREREKRERERQREGEREKRGERERALCVHNKKINRIRPWARALLQRLPLTPPLRAPTPPFCVALPPPLLSVEGGVIHSERGGSIASNPAPHGGAEV